MTPEQILSEEVFTIHARPKTGAEHIAALAEAGYRIVPTVDDATLLTERVALGGRFPGDPIYYNPDHRPFVPVEGGAPPFCSCGWRSAVFPKPGEFMADHLRKHDE